MAIDSNLGAVVGEQREGAIESIPASMSAPSEEDCVPSQFTLKHSDWERFCQEIGPQSILLDAVLKSQHRTTKHLWLIACDAEHRPKKYFDGTRRSVNVQIKECQRRMG